MVVPVSVAVAATARRTRRATSPARSQFGGEDVATAQSDLLYNNGSVFGGTDWAWRAESGDWRFFFFDLAKAPAAGYAVPDRHDVGGRRAVHRPRHADHGPVGEPVPAVRRHGPFGAPYILNTVGKSQNTNTGAGVWKFDTATRRTREVITAPAQEGLQSLVQHQVGWTGDKFDVPFTTKLGSATVSRRPSRQSTATADTGSFDVTFNVERRSRRAGGRGLRPQPAGSRRRSRSSRTIRMTRRRRRSRRT